MVLQGNGTRLNPYKIHDHLEFQEIRNDLTAYYQLMNDISFPSGSNHTPIGDDFSSSFTGTLDGQGYTIRDLIIISDKTSYVGLFGYINGGTVKNLIINTPTVTMNVDSNFIGVLSGYLYSDFVIDNVEIKGGSLTGFSNTTTNVGAISGGIAGTSSKKGTLKDIIVRNIAINNGSRLGGITSTIGNCNLIRVFSFPASYTGTNNRSFAYTISTTATVINSGGIGSSVSGTVPTGLWTRMEVNNAWKDIPSYMNPNPTVGWTGIDMSANAVWNMSQGDLPYLNFRNVERNAFYLSTESDLSKINSYPHGYFVLLNDIDMTSTLNSSFVSNEFTGTLDGKGNYINNLNISNISTVTNLFSNMSGVVKDVKFNISNINSTSSIILFNLANKGGILERVNITVSNELRTSSPDAYVYGISDYSGDTYIIDSFFDFNNVIVGQNPSLKFIPIGKSLNKGTLTRNIVKLNSLFVNNVGLQTSNILLYDDGVVSASDLIGYFVGSGEFTGTNVTNILSEEQFTNPNNVAYTNFKENWRFQLNYSPIQKIFSRIINKIETVTVKNYAKKVLTSFKKFKGKVKVTKSHVNKMILNFIKTTKLNKTVKSNMNRLQLKLSLIKKMIIKNKSVVNKIKFRVINNRKNLIISNFFSRNMILKSKIKSISKNILYAVSYMSNIKDKNKTIKKSHKVSNGSIDIGYRFLKNIKTSTIVKTFSKKMNVNTFRSILSATKNYSNKIITRVNRWSNVVKKMTVSVKNHSLVILNNVSRRVNTERKTHSFTKGMTSKTSRFVIVQIAKDYYAVVSYKIRKVFTSVLKKY